MSEQLSMTSSHTKDAALPLLNQLEKSLAKFIGAEAMPHLLYGYLSLRVARSWPSLYDGA
jgi:7-keto-8-aminopelargonate synthetase-like enzyme